VNITIIIPTKNRSVFIARQLKYYSESGFSGHIFIGDSSDTHEYQYNKRSIEKYSNSLNIMHFYDKSFSAERMISHLCTYVKTDYLSALMDDDIILTKSLYECICYLDNNPDYSAVHGKSFLMEIDACSDQPYGSSVLLMEVDEMAVSEGELSDDRISDYFKNVLNVNMSVVRKDIGINSFKEVCKLSNYYAKNIFGELIQATMVISSGKIKELDCYYLIRQVHHGQLFHKIQYYDWFTGADWRDSYEFMIDTINTGFVECEPKNNKDCYRRAEYILKEYITKLMADKLSHKKVVKHSFYIKVKVCIKQIKIVKLIIEYYRPVKTDKKFQKFIFGNNNSSLKDLIIYRGIVLNNY